MDADTLGLLATLIRSGRTASLGTLRDGAPLVSLVAYAFAPDFSAFYLHLSRLAQHTQALLADPRLALMMAESDDGRQDPQTLARVSIQGEARLIPRSSAGYDPVKSLYIARFPDSAALFDLGDFELYCAEPRTARFVAGFARAYNLTAEHFRSASRAG